MMQGMLLLLMAILDLVGILTICVIATEGWKDYIKAMTAVKAAVPCEHQWEPWSDPVDVAAPDREHSGKKIQERLCSKCNIYERRWA